MSILNKVTGRIIRSDFLGPKASFFSVLPMYGLGSFILLWEAGSPGALAGAWKFHTLLLTCCLLLEAGVVVLSTIRFLLDKVFLSGNDLAQELIRQTEVEQSVREIGRSCSSPGTVEIKELAGRVLRLEPLSCVAVRRLLVVGVMGTRLFLAFSFTTVVLVYLMRYVGAYDGIPIDAGFLSVVDRALYTNLVTMSTVGFGDVHPGHLSWSCRLLVDIQIVSCALFLLVGVNSVIGSILEGSGVAWESRRALIEDHLSRVFAEFRRVPPV